MAAAPLTTKLIESTSMAPPPGTTPDHASLPFTYFDICWLNEPPVECLFFYRYPHSTTHFLSSLLPSLKSSLSLALKTYYPLAGGFRQTPDTDNKLEHYYTEGDAVLFTVAECNGQFEDLASDSEHDISELNCLAPQLPRSEEVQPLCAAQVTIFPDQGIVIATSMHHTACDGISSAQFMHTWAETCLLGASVSRRLPAFDRTLISDRSDLYTYVYNEAQEKLKATLQGDALANKPSDLVLATFRFGQEQIQRLKKLFSPKADERASFHLSTIVVAFAYVWTGFVRAKCIDNTKRACLGIPANFRAQVQPPLPIEYFGNCIGPCIAIAHVADLVQENGVIAAAEAVGKAVDQLNKCSIISKGWRGSASGLPVVIVAGSPKFKFYDLDFGIGRPTKVKILSAAKTGAIAVADNRDDQGGVEFGMALSGDEMDCFKKYFFEGLKLLSG